MEYAALLARAQAALFGSETALEFERAAAFGALNIPARIAKPPLTFKATSDLPCALQLYSSFLLTTLSSKGR